MNDATKTNIWEEIDYCRHAVIEASAGTGKTYTLEHIVLELILKHNVQVNEILIVTFTEKAAGEIKDRVRKIITEELDNALVSGNTSDALQLKNAIDIFDSADISTIHGFCKKVLSQYAFENGSALSQEISNKTFTTEAFNNVILSNEFSACGGIKILESFFSGEEISDMDESLGLIEAFRENALNNIVLADYQELDQTDLAIIDDFDNLCTAIKNDITNILGLGNYDPNQHYRITTFFDLAHEFGVNGQKIKKYPENLKKYDQTLTDILNKKTAIEFPPSNGAFDTNFTTGALLYIDNGQKKRDYQTLEQLCPQLHSIYKNIKESCQKLEELFKKNKKTFQKRLIDLVLKERKRLKEEHQTISFDDLIINFDNALQPSAANSVALINALREKYKIALIDEFQDTDALQWDIFSRIFTTFYKNEYSEDSFNVVNNSLIVVGDPKQAIYKFRGADLNTYFLAKDIIVNKLNGQLFNLDTTYRCTNEMVKVYNTFFGGQDWFSITGAPESFKTNDIEYIDVLSPEENSKTTSWFPPEFSTVNIVNCRYKNFNEYIKGCASAITQLVNIETDKGPCTYGDFCFLVRGKGEALQIANILKYYKLPYLYQKDSSLYESDEATNIIIILKFLLEPNNRKLRNAALLTDFYDADPRSIHVLANISSLDLPCFQKWLEYLHANKWEKLFHSMLYDSGLYYRLCDRMKDNVAAEIKLGTYNQLFEELLVAAKEQQLSVYEFPNFLKGIKRQTTDEEIENSLKKVTDDPRIKIMTMHASKGLEFKFVFYCAGFKNEPTAKHCTDHYSTSHSSDANAISKVQSLYFNKKFIPPKDQDIIIYDDRCELRRLTYVAITRAQYMIFFPCGKDTDSAATTDTTLHLAYSESNPMNNFVGPALMRLATSEETNGLIKIYAPDFSKLITYTSQQEGIDISNENNLNGEQVYYPIWDLPNLMRNKISLDSFSSINEHHKDTQKEISFDEENEKENDEPENNEEAKENVEKASTLLPPGATFGKCFHEIMELLAKGANGIDFSYAVRIKQEYVYTDRKLDEIVRAAMLKYGIQDQFCLNDANKIIDSSSNELKRMVWNTLNMPIPLLGEKKLGDLKTSDMKAELEFYINKNDYLTEEEKNNIMIGFIDLLFRVDGKYYILDWKTNMLPSYDSATVNDAMNEANYTLQHQIYSVATIQWFARLFGNNIEKAKELLDGTVYLFVRGGAKNLGDKPGSYEKAWTPDDFSETCDRIKEEIKQSISFAQLNDY